MHTPLRSQKIEKALTSVITAMMDKVMDKVLYTDPFVKEDHHAKKPIYAALVPDEIFKGSHFERRFVTPFGKLWEKLAVTVARQNEEFAEAETDYRVEGLVRQGRLQRIQETLNRLEGRGQSPDWDSELEYIRAGKGEFTATHVTCDVLVRARKGKASAFEIKAPLPNSDQTKVSKEKIFKLYAMSPQIAHHAYFALPYNPYGRKEDYAWSFPGRWFDMKNDKCVLIGEELWDLLGGTGTHPILKNTVLKLGKEYKKRIYWEYLGIEPPKEGHDFQLQPMRS